MEEIAIIWKKPHNKSVAFHVGTINIYLDKLIKRYGKKLQIRQIMVDLEMPKDAAGFSNKTFILKIHLTLKSGKIIIAKSTDRSIVEAMKNINSEIENQTDLTDRQKHSKKSL